MSRGSIAHGLVDVFHRAIRILDGHFGAAHHPQAFIFVLHYLRVFNSFESVLLDHQVSDSFHINFYKRYFNEKMQTEALLHLHLIEDLGDHPGRHAHSLALPVLDTLILALSRAKHTVCLPTPGLSLHQHCRVEPVQNHVHQRLHDVFLDLLLRSVVLEHAVLGEDVLLLQIAVLVFHPYLVAIHS